MALQLGEQLSTGQTQRSPGTPTLRGLVLCSSNLMLLGTSRAPSFPPKPQPVLGTLVEVTCAYSAGCRAKNPAVHGALLPRATQSPVPAPRTPTYCRLHR